MTFYESASSARAALIEAGLRPETARLDADLLARHAAGWDLEAWLSQRSETATAAFTERFDSLMARRLRREPVAYIRGVQEFWGRDFLVTPAVLIPRPETELLVEAAQEFLNERPSPVVVDVGTGSGCLAITLALDQPLATIYAVDVSEAALGVARANAARYGVLERVHFRQGTYLADTPSPVDLIVTNPPYVPERDRPGLAPEVREHEPAVALFGGDDGWDVIRAILREASKALAPGGCLMMEIGFGQSELIAAEVAAVKTLRLHDVLNDLQGIARVAIVDQLHRRA